MKTPGISNERQGQLLRAVFAILLEHPDGLPGREVLRQMQERLPPTEYEAGFHKTNQKDNRGAIATRWWTVDCVKAGWMEKPASGWKITDEGKRAYETYTDPREFAREANRQMYVWRAEQSGDDAEVDSGTATGDGESAPTEVAVVASAAIETASEDAWSEIQAYLAQMDPYSFQDLVAALLRAMGYHVSWVAPPGPDRGLDILAFTDPLGTSGPRIKVQVKRQQQKVTAEGARAFLATLGPQDVGLFVCTGGFSSDAEREVRYQESRRVSLLDLERLVELWVAYIDKVADPSLLPLKPIWFLALPPAQE
jgi:restriction system protein